MFLTDLMHKMFTRNPLYSASNVSKPTLNTPLNAKPYQASSGFQVKDNAFSKPCLQPAAMASTSFAPSKKKKFKQATAKSREFVRVSMSALALLGLLAISPLASAQTTLNNINLPQTPQFPQGTDRIRAADGTECSRSTAPRNKYMDMGVLGFGAGGQGVENQYPIVYGANTGNYNIPNNSYQRAGGGVYARLVINLDNDTPNVDCGKLYELELERLKLELEQGKMGTGSGVSQAKAFQTLN
jgi:hypothetical protein